MEILSAYLFLLRAFRRTEASTLMGTLQDCERLKKLMSAMISKEQSVLYMLG
jgi:hypothetical protein